MSIFKTIAILAFFFAQILVIGCGGRDEPSGAVNSSSIGSNLNASPANKASGDAEELGMLINFQMEPEDLTWKVDEKKKTLVAVVRLGPDMAKKLQEQLAGKSTGTPHEVSTDDWFPAELIAQGETRGGSTIEGTAFQADDFYRPPYSEGTITRINETEFFVIELHAK